MSMRFVSDAQRKAMFARMGMGKQKTRRRVGLAAAGAATIAAGARIIQKAPQVMHLPAKMALKRYAPILGMHMAVPAGVAAYAMHKKYGSKLRENKGKLAAAVGAGAAAGAGMFFGQRALVHSVALGLPKKILTKYAPGETKFGIARDHVLPLATIGAAGTYAGLSKGFKDPQAQTQKKKMLASAGMTSLASVGGLAALSMTNISPGIIGPGSLAIEAGVSPVTEYMYRNKRKKRRGY